MRFEAKHDGVNFNLKPVDPTAIEAWESFFGKYLNGDSIQTANILSMMRNVGYCLMIYRSQHPDTPINLKISII